MKMCRLFSTTKKKKESGKKGAVNIFPSLHILISRSIMSAHGSAAEERKLHV